MVEFISVSTDLSQLSVSVFQQEIYNLGASPAPPAPPAPFDHSVQTSLNMIMDRPSVNNMIMDRPSVDNIKVNDVKPGNYLTWDRMWEIYPYVKYPLIMTITACLIWAGYRHIYNSFDLPPFVSVDVTHRPRFESGSFGAYIPNLEGWIFQNHWFENGVSRYSYNTGIRSDYFTIGYMNNNLQEPLHHYTSLHIHSALMNELVGLPIDITFAYDFLFNEMRLFFVFA